ncbi:GNAT family N-acetyltransferase [bacterium]|jgi:ribosomal protein S18 acetylase RimI-like enzyme|nr:GNAT family N-acetyltransferase [bacterium]
MIILLNGCINSGKTSVAQAIVHTSEGFAHIEVDALRDFIPWMPLEESIELNLRNAISVAINLNEEKIHSIVAYPLSRVNFEFVKELLKDTRIEVFPITLYPGLELLKSNRGSRELTPWELSRIDVLHQAGYANPGFGTLINNSRQTIEETAHQVLKIVAHELHQSNHSIRFESLKIDDVEERMVVHSLMMRGYQAEAELLGIKEFPPLNRKPEELNTRSSNFYGCWRSQSLAALVELEIQQDHVWIASLVVDPDHFRSGLGSRLLNWALKPFSAYEFRVSTALQNFPAINLYKKLGFQEFERSLTPEKIKIVTYRKTPSQSPSQFPRVGL